MVYSVVVFVFVLIRLQIIAGVSVQRDSKRCIKNVLLLLWSFMINVRSQQPTFPMAPLNCRPICSNFNLLMRKFTTGFSQCATVALVLDSSGPQMNLLCIVAFLRPSLSYGLQLWSSRETLELSYLISARKCLEARGLHYHKFCWLPFECSRCLLRKLFTLWCLLLWPAHSRNLNRRCRNHFPNNGARRKRFNARN